MIPTPRRIRQHNSLVTVFHRLADALAIAGGLTLVAAIAPAMLNVPTSLAGAEAVILYFVLAEARGTYRNWRGISPNRELASAVGTWACTLPTMVAGHWVYDRLTDTFAPWNRAVLLEWFLLTILLLSALRLGARHPAAAASGGHTHARLRRAGRQ